MTTGLESFRNVGILTQPAGKCRGLADKVVWKEVMDDRALAERPFSAADGRVEVRRDCGCVREHPG